MSNSQIESLDLDLTLQERFSLESFRPGQREVIENVLKGRDVLCVMPTGGGKSLCYQLPAVLLPGLTLVISPLIALMKDQVDSLHQRGIKATLLNSSLDPEEQRQRILEIEARLYDLVYVAPERFRSGRFLEMMKRVRPSLLAVDEAHCISQWGHDFRPDYAKIGEARKALGSPPCIALTATATDLVRRDIVQQLDLDDPANFVTGFDRPNLSYAVEEARTDANKLEHVGRVLREHPGPSIIYASSRKKCEEIAFHVSRELRRTAAVYHAGMTREERSSAQDRFMSGEADVVVATNAFGMGVDKPDIRSVIHFSIPGTVEAYYQEAGRAGRDGLPSACVLLFSAGDQMLQQRFIENEFPDPSQVFAVYSFLKRLPDDPIERTQRDIKLETDVDLSDSGIGTAVKLLETAGLLERFLPRENQAIVRINLEEVGGSNSLVGRLGTQANVQRIVLLGLEGLLNGRFNEPVYFQPDELAQALGLDKTAFLRAVKALTTELPIDYVPPFRGNAIRMIDRSRKVRDLGIDFKALEVRKQREFEKLDRMVKYARSNRCRRAYILGYFGDAEADKVHCGHCDNCGIGSRPARPSFAVENDAAREILLKTLSGVGRAKGRCGKSSVAQMLRGSGSERMEKLGLKQLSTFGILNTFGEQELVQLMDSLHLAGLVDMPEIAPQRPVVKLTDAGWNYLKAPETIQLSISNELAAKLTLTSSAPTIENERKERSADPKTREQGPLYEALKAKRLEWSKAEGKRAFHIFTDATLDALVRSEPKTPAELAEISGIGKMTMERFGKAILDVILGTSEKPSREEPFAESSPSRPQSPAVSLPRPQTPVVSSPRPQTLAASHFSRPQSPAVSPPSRPQNSLEDPTKVTAEEWVFRLLERGFRAEEVAVIKGIELLVVLRLALLSMNQGKSIPLDRFLSEHEVVAWNDWQAENGDETPPDDRAHASELWKLFLKSTR